MKKVCVYAIVKNESQFVERWYNSVKEADLVIVGDTGSTDNTVEELKKYNIKVYNIEIKPWRFDEARNKVLELIPEDIDICISVDLDEIITAGWKDKILEFWKDNTTRLKYTYNWSFDKYGNPAVTFFSEKIHSRKDYRWVHPVHEVLKYTGIDKERIEYATGFEINHYPDSTKSRSNYLPLLELSIEEDPEDDRNMHYLGREYMYNNMWDKAISTLKKHLNLKNATWRDERAASMRYIARCYKRLRKDNEAREWLYKAIIEAPYTREAYGETAMLENECQNWPAVYHMCIEALKIEQKSMIYINESFCWDGTIFDLLSISCYNIGLFEDALKYSNQALDLNPDDKRLIGNNKMIREKIENKVENKE